MGPLEYIGRCVSLLCNAVLRLDRCPEIMREPRTLDSQPAGRNYSCNAQGNLREFVIRDQQLRTIIIPTRHPNIGSALPLRTKISVILEQKQSARTHQQRESCLPSPKIGLVDHKVSNPLVSQHRMMPDSPKQVLVHTLYVNCSVDSTRNARSHSSSFGTWYERTDSRNTRPMISSRISASCIATVDAKRISRRGS